MDPAFRTGPETDTCSSLATVYTCSLQMGVFQGNIEWLPFMPTNRIRAVSAANVPTELHGPALLAPWGIESQEVYETSRVRVS